jgi:hypothetical protein
MASVIYSPRFWGCFAVLLPNGEVIDCANLRTARQYRDTYNKEHSEQNNQNQC